MTDKILYDYEDTLTKSQIKKLGVVYTPSDIVRHINQRCLDRWDRNHPPKVVDFSSGTGVFLVDMCERISSRYNISTEEVYEKYIFANDIDQAATSIFSKHTGCVNISNEDGLVFDISEFDI